MRRPALALVLLATCAALFGCRRDPPPPASTSASVPPSLPAPASVSVSVSASTQVPFAASTLASASASAGPAASGAPSATASAASAAPCSAEGLPSKVLQWVNRTRCLVPCGFHPPDLVHLPGTYLELRKEAAEGLWQMQVEASRKGVSLGVRSAYRAYGTQVLTFGVWMAESSCADAQRGSAVPGHSEHQLGDAVDFAAWDLRANKLLPGQDAVPLWLAANACKYGWLLSYPPYEGPPPSGYIHEPWHWRFVGREIAQLVKPVVDGVCTEKYKSLEEYLAAHPAAAVSGTCQDCPNPWNASDGLKACIATAVPSTRAATPPSPSPCETCETRCWLEGDRATAKPGKRCAAPGQYARLEGSVGTTECYRCGGPTKLGDKTVSGSGWIGGARRVVCETAAETR